jgi:hypothetical protein
MKYRVTRTRDGSSPEWPFFVLGAPDAVARAALAHYADLCEARGYDAGYVAMVRYKLAELREVATDRRPDEDGLVRLDKLNGMDLFAVAEGTFEVSASAARNAEGILCVSVADPKGQRADGDRFQVFAPETLVWPVYVAKVA